MSEPAKKEKSFSDKLWGFCWTAALVLLALIILGYVLMTLFPMLLQTFSSFLQVSSVSLMQLGVTGPMFGASLRVGMNGVFAAVMPILLFVLVVAAVGFVIHSIFSGGKKKEEKGGHAAPH